MLPRQTVPVSLAELLAVFRPHLTAPSYRTFCALTCGLISAGGRRTVTGMLAGAGLAGRWHHSRAHHLFAYARWCPDRLGLAVARLVVARLLGADEPITVVIDDTLFRRWGRRVHLALWTHDGSVQGPDRLGRGNRWVIAGIVVRLPCCTRPVCVPVLFRLWAGKATASVVDLAAQLLGLLAVEFPDRRLHAVGDAHYHGRALLGAGASITTRLPVNAALFGPAPPRTGQRGRPRLKGAPLGRLTQIAASAGWAPAQVDRYGRREQVRLAELPAIWYGPFRNMPGRLILISEPGPAHAGSDYLALFSTDLTSPPEHIVARYAARWSIEVAIFDAKQITGAGQARNRVRRAVERTVPFALLVQALVVLWYAGHGDPAADVAAARAAAPWYTTKHEPGYADMHAALARAITAAAIFPNSPDRPSDDEIRAVLAAWQAAEVPVPA
jgi:hypothetical protein